MEAGVGIHRLGPIPHAALNFSRFRGGRGSRGKPLFEIDQAEAGDDGEKPSSNAKKKQSTRLLKACCTECGYTVRITKKWALSHGAECPKCGPMEIEGLDED